MTARRREDTELLERLLSAIGLFGSKLFSCKNRAARPCWARQITSYDSIEEVCDEGSGGQEVVTALDRTLQETHMRQEATRVTLSTTPVSEFAPTTIQCGKRTCSVRVEVSSQFFNVTAGNIVRIHVKSVGNPFPSTGFDIDGGINRPVAILATAAHLKTGLSPGSHSVAVEFDMRSPGGTAEAGIRTLMIQVFTP